MIKKQQMIQRRLIVAQWEKFEIFALIPHFSTIPENFSADGLFEFVHSTLTDCCSAYQPEILAIMVVAECLRHNIMTKVGINIFSDIQTDFGFSISARFGTTLQIPGYI